MKKTNQSKLVPDKGENNDDFIKINQNENWRNYMGKKVQFRQYKGTIKNIGSHYILETKKKTPPLHDFPYKSPGRECPRRLLCSPYKGCLHNCVYCYAILNPLYGLGNKNVIFTNYAEAVKNQIEKMPIVFPLYMSQDTDPFQQPIESHYGITRKLTEYFVEKQLSFEYITKNFSAIKILDITNGYDNYLIQYSIISLDENIKSIFEPNASSIDARFKALEDFSDTGCYSIVRIDPILPYITDDRTMLKELVSQAKEYGANHIITSVCDLSAGVWNRSLNKVLQNFGGDALIKKWRDLYWSKNSLLRGKWPDEKYRIDILTYVHELVKKNKMTFAACQENVNRMTTGNVIGEKYLDHQLMTSSTCEGKSLPAVIRSGNGGLFEPVNGCDSDCVICQPKNEPPCGYSGLRLF